MVSIFNPYVLLGLVLAFLGTFYGGYTKGEQIAKRDADIASGALRLRIPVQTACPVSTSDNPTPPGGNSVQATAELDPTVARSLVAITDQGDANTRQLNACIDAYNEVRTSLIKGAK